MKIVRRVYLYLTSFIGLLVLIAGTSSLLGLFLKLWLFNPNDYQVNFGNDNYFRDQFSLYGAVTLVSAIIWAIHWILAQRSLDGPEGKQERGSVLRKLMIYAVLAVSAFIVLAYCDNLLFQFLINLNVLDSFNFKYALSDGLPAILTCSIAWGYYFKVSRTDNRLEPEKGGSATVRRWYFYLANYLTLSLLAFNIAGVLQYSWRAINGVNYETYGTPVSNLIAGALASVAVALPAWLWLWWMVQHMAASSEEEKQAVLRKVYLYAVIIQMVAVTLTSLTFFMYNLLRFMLGSNLSFDNNDTLLTAAGSPLFMALVFGTFWMYHGRVLKLDTQADLHETPDQISLRRLYDYLVALVSLTVLAIGIIRLIRILSDYWLGGIATINLTHNQWSDEISLFTTLILVGGSVWFYSWRNLQKMALAKGATEERQSIFRRIYLYLVLFSSVVTLLGSTIWLFYQILTIISGASTLDTASNISWAIGVTITGAVALVYHIQVMLSDQQAKSAITLDEENKAVSRLIYIEGYNPTLLNNSLARLKSKLPANYIVESIPIADLNLYEIKERLSNPKTQIRDTASPEKVAVG